MGKITNKIKTIVSNKLADYFDLNEEKVFQMCERMVNKSDAEATIDDGVYDERIQRLMQNVKSVNGKPLDVKVYIDEEVNARAFYNNVVRVNSGLMDIMKDNELMAIIGHEIGHIVNGDSQRALLNSFCFEEAADIIKKYISTGLISSIVLDKVVVKYLESHYSRLHEEKADDYGLKFAVSQGYSPSSMADALDILVKMDEGESSFKIRKFFSSHPDSKKRAQRLREMGNKEIRLLKGEY